MIRRRFIKDISSYTFAGMALGKFANSSLDKYKDVIVGHGSHKYKIDLDWGKLDSLLYPVNDCHEMVMDSKGRLILLTNHIQNNIIIYDKNGALIEVWGTDFPGAHGLTIHQENGNEVLFITDIERNAVFKTDMNGQLLMSIKYPDEIDLYKEASQFKPTETAIASNGDIYVADGYGLQHILHYDASGKLKNSFGGHGDADSQFTNAHGICIDQRNGEETLLITDRMKNQLKQFSLEGDLLGIINLPGVYPCRPVIHNDNVYLATIWSGNGSAATGFISILDKENKLISAPCGSKPQYHNGKLNQMYQTLKVFQHPHDVCIDNEDNLYVAQWNAGKSYPIKLIRV